MPRFFGPTKNTKTNFLEEAFVLQYHLKMNYTDIRGMPITYRRWFISRLREEFEKQEKISKERENSQRGEIVKEIPMGEMSDIMNRMSPDVFSAPKKF